VSGFLRWLFARTTQALAPTLVRPPKPTGSAAIAVIRDAALIVLVEDNMLTRSIHGRRLKRFASEPGA
jgi:hypothetical protein